jgi:hypothetical protein
MKYKTNQTTNPQSEAIDVLVWFQARIFSLKKTGIGGKQKKKAPTTIRSLSLLIVENSSERILPFQDVVPCINS